MLEETWWAYVLLLMSYFVAVRWPKLGIPIYWVGGFSVLGVTLMAGPLALLAAVLGLGFFTILFLLIRPRSPWIAPGVGVAVMLMVFGVMALHWSLVLRPQIHYYRDLDPVVSLETRLDAFHSTAVRSFSTSEQDLKRFEGQLGDWEAANRYWYLRRLHDQKVDRFTHAPGFGMNRMTFHSPYESDLAPRPSAEVQKWINGDSQSESLSGSEQWQRLPNDERFRQFHFTSLLDFLNLDRMGNIISRREVAGFSAHQFQKVPQAPGAWNLRSLQLVGLLRHDKPVVYLSVRLPQMDKLNDVPTRSLSEFEQKALEKIRNGENVIVEQSSDRGRMLGAIRSTSQCLKCHDGNRGDLLGAFSYSFEHRPELTSKTR